MCNCGFVVCGRQFGAQQAQPAERRQPAQNLCTIADRFVTRAAQLEPRSSKIIAGRGAGYGGIEWIRGRQNIQSLESQRRAGRCMQRHNLSDAVSLGQTRFVSHPPTTYLIWGLRLERGGVEGRGR